MPEPLSPKIGFGMNVAVLPCRAGDVLDDVLVGHDLVGHPRQRLEAQVDLALAAGGDLVVVELARDAEPLERQHHLACAGRAACRAAPAGSSPPSARIV